VKKMITISLSNVHRLRPGSGRKAQGKKGVAVIVFETVICINIF
jgi:hypothetical protein